MDIPPQFVISVDTEEEGLWGGGYRVRENTTENLRGLPRFQAACESLGVPPTYLIDAPVLEDRMAMDDLAKWQDSGVCEVGTHCHPWCSPPLSDQPPTKKETYLCNLPVEVQLEKLRWLSERIAESTGRYPTSYRAGRYGYDSASGAVLAELGYKVDSSVLPMHEYVDQGGPDFLLSSRRPYHEPSGLLEIPVTSGFTKPGFEGKRDWFIRLRQTPWKYLKAAGITDRLGLVRRVKLTPEGTRVEDLINLVDSCIEDGLTTLVLMLHSSSLVPGFSPYAKDAAALDQLYDRLGRITRHMIQRHHLNPVTLTNAAENLEGLH